MSRILIGLVLWAASAVAVADFSYVLRNSHTRPVTFQFYSWEFLAWEDEAAATLSDRDETPHTLRSRSPYYIRVYTDHREYGREFDVAVYDIVQRLREQGKPPVLTLKMMEVSEEQTRIDLVTRMVPEERTKTYTIMKSVAETRTKTVTRRDPQTGELYDVEIPYTVYTQVPEEVTKTYTVMVRTTEQVERTYTVVRPRLSLVADVDGQEVPIDSPMPRPPARDARTRYLGVGLADSADGPLVVKVMADSPASRLQKVGLAQNRRFRIVADRNVITHINGHRVHTVRQAVDRLQESPPIAVLGILDRRSGCSATFRATLDMR